MCSGAIATYRPRRYWTHSPGGSRMKFRAPLPSLPNNPGSCLAGFRTAGACGRLLLSSSASCFVRLLMTTTPRLPFALQLRKSAVPVPLGSYGNDRCPQMPGRREEHGRSAGGSPGQHREASTTHLYHPAPHYAVLTDARTLITLPHRRKDPHLPHQRSQLELFPFSRKPPSTPSPP